MGQPNDRGEKLDIHNKYGVIFVLPAFKKVKREEAAGHGGGLGMRIIPPTPPFDMRATL